MNTVATQTDGGARRSASARDRAKQPSKLLSSLFRSVDSGKRLNILEVGSALPETVEFFSGFKCRIHFVDLFADSVVKDLQKESTPQELQQHFTDLLNLPDGTRLDICLLWDFLCYLDDSALRAFNNALRPYINYGTRAHGFGVHHLAIRLDNKQYGILDEDTMSVRRRQIAQGKTHPHSQVEMHEMFSCFDFERGLLLPDGKLELLLKSRVDAQDS